MLLKFTTIDRIFQFVSKLKPNGFNEYDIIDWTAEALEHMQTPKQFEEAICYAEVSNYQINIPQWTHNIIQIVRDTEFVASSNNCICPINILTDSTTEDEESETTPLPCQNFPVGTNNPVVVNQLGQPITDFELAYYRPYFDLQYDYLSWTSSYLYNGRFTPVRLSTNHFFNSIVCSSTQDTDLYLSCTDEYTIIKGQILRFSFETGAVVISYLRQITDNGLPMIPDEVSCITAIQKYILMKFAEQDFYNHREGAETRLSKAEADWHWYCGQFINKMKMPSSIDEWQNLLEGRNYLIPRNHYYGYFGHFNKEEQRTFLQNP